METTTYEVVSEKGPVIPKWIFYLAKWIIPSFDRDIVLGDVRSLKCKSQREYFWGAATIVGGVIKARMMASFGFPLLFGEAAFLFLPAVLLRDGTSLIPFAALYTLLIILFRLRDAYLYPAQGSVPEMLGDTMFALLMVGTAEGAFMYFTPRLALPFSKLILAAAAVVMVSQWRKVSRREDSPDPNLKKLHERLIAAWHMNILFMAACIPVTLSNIEAVPGGRIRDRLLGFLPIFCMGLAQRLRKEHYISIWQEPPVSITNTTPELDVLSYHRAVLWFKDRKSAFPVDLISEFAYFAVLLSPHAEAAWQWASNDPRAAQVDWLQLAVNLGAVMVLALMWTEIKNRNRKLANAIQQYIDKNRPGAGTGEAKS